MNELPEAARLTTITALIARSGHEAAIAGDFEQAFTRAGDNSHHLAALLIQQQNGISFLVSQFRDHEQLAAWRASAAYRQMIADFERHSLRELCTIDEPVARIAVPSDDSGPKWKVFLSTWIVTYPMLLGISAVFSELAPGMPFAARLALTSIMVTIAIIWVISPVTRRLTRTWRLRNRQMRIDVIRYRCQAVT
jgi:antibiotic biosynthesis monooxygenase (ABM) superfamily enzyme